ncbi:hypothetical protein KQ51_01789 [Candidatus Izimaplasma bacterium HR1]|jgi:cell fate (sporulation/competence/biofilm development) regulator YlbF (YheA/YmcA/DUF963 family)|uniref:YlbF family regulator n=1 Tax=Candidatus Izimoplasma sp. HR1 TaxID=1541959 RepID=UPI0004F86DA1|nr:hypothetical protein KQ51_01789 [Candidatus Izimaplasma bacterium HR1]
MKQEIIEKTYELVDEIKQKRKYKRLLELNKEIKKSLQIQELINNFQNLNLKFEEVSKYGKYHPDLKQVQIKFSEAKTNLYTNEIVKEYKELENILQQELDEISSELALNISKKIRHPNEIGLINKH